MPGEGWMAALPGGELLRVGLEDYEAGRETAAAYLVAIAEARLRRGGVLQGPAQAWPEPEHRLYRRVGEEEGDAYTRYNALLRELDSFLSALEQRRGREVGGVGRG